ncbi:MAG: HxsD-like protein [Candidatus Omnitrophica bacterium]|nr:HxsD-like protein [Candidatus Omnitrophota bacterium]MDD5352620.1 HxsD-like protein [Candidatus Omnitrophota bacterium]MDD5550219.1 HxsD-like protein [Candidatus Omnitrophota bacterium]
MPKVRFNTKIYKKKAIQNAVSAYSNLARFSLKQTNSYIEVKIDKVSSGFNNIIIGEFSNYVLALTKKCL